MILGDFDTIARMDKLEENLRYVKIIKNSISDDRAKYRDFATNISIDFEAIQQCCDTFERNLLIDAYTYAEQLVKNFYYKVLEKDSLANSYIDKFVDNKLNPERFSPNVKYSELEKSLNRELIDNFKFILSESKDEIKSYNELVMARHHYAHAGVFSFSWKYEEVICVLKYISLELEMVIDKGVIYRKKYQDDIKEINEATNKIDKKIKTYKINKAKDLKRKIIEEVKDYRKMCSVFLNTYCKYLEKSEFFDDFLVKLNSISDCDLRKSEECFDAVLELKDTIIITGIK